MLCSKSLIQGSTANLLRLCRGDFGEDDFLLLGDKERLRPGDDDLLLLLGDLELLAEDLDDDDDLLLRCGDVDRDRLVEDIGEDDFLLRRGDTELLPEELDLDLWDDPDLRRRGDDPDLRRGDAECDRRVDL